MSRLAVALLLLCATATQAAVVSPRPDRVALSIYHLGTVDTAALAQNGGGQRYGGLALVSETRALDLPAGPVEIQFRGVAGTMVPQTAQVTGLPAPVKESNFDFDLLSPGALIEKSLGKTVHRIRSDPESGAETDESATILSGPNGTVLKIGDRYEALGCSGGPERLVFDSLPASLFDSPTLSLRTMVPRAGHYNVTLRYIATGLNWSADYVARLNPGGRTLDLSGWITLANFSESSFANAPVDVIAGQLRTTGRDRTPNVQAAFRQTQCWPVNISGAPYDFETVVVTGTIIAPAARAAVGSNILAAPPPPPPASIEARNLGDYKLYPLNEPTTVAARQTKQVQFLDRHAVPFRRVYRAGVDSYLQNIAHDETLPAAILLRLDNSTRGGLGKPLPAGGISTMIDTDGTPMLIGQDRIDDISVGLPLEIATGSTMAVRAQAHTVQTATLQRGKEKIRRTTLEVTAINDKDENVNFEWRQEMTRAGTKLTAQSRPHDEKNGNLLWVLALKPGEKTLFRYTLEQPE